MREGAGDLQRQAGISGRWGLRDVCVGGPCLGGGVNAVAVLGAWHLEIREPHEKMDGKCCV